MNPTRTRARKTSRTAAIGRMNRQGMPIGRSAIGGRCRPARAPGGRRLRMPVGFQELDVPGVRLEADVEEVAEQGDGTDGDVDQHVGRHARGDGPGHLVMPQRDQHQPGLHQPGEHVPADRQQAEQRVEPDADPRAGDVEGPVHQPGQPLQVAGQRLAPVEFGVVMDRPGFAGYLAHAVSRNPHHRGWMSRESGGRPPASSFIRREIAVIQGRGGRFRRRRLGDDLAARRVVLADIRGVGTEDVRLVGIEIGSSPDSVRPADLPAVSPGRDAFNMARSLPSRIVASDSPIP